jgi:hypothetical protein
MKCPTCGEPVKWQDNPYRPFCSERCKLIDFGRWANEEYCVPGEAMPSADEGLAGQASRDSNLPHEEE